MTKFSIRLKMLRKRAGLTQTQLAEKLGFSPGAVGNWESDMAMPSRQSMRKVAEILNTTELFLTGDSDIEPGAFTEPSTEYSGALPFERMTDLELDFIYESRQRQLNETNDPQLRRELLGVIADVASELQKRIPSELEAEATRRAISAGDNREVKPEEKKK